MRRDRESLCGFLRRHAAEIPHLDQLDLERMRARQLFQSFIHRQQGSVRLMAQIGNVRQRNFRHGAPLYRGPRTSRVHQNLAHQPGSNSIKVGAVFVGRMLCSGEPQKGLVDQGRGLQWLRPALPA
jgi:hypothetical protein